MKKKNLLMLFIGLLIIASGILLVIFNNKNSDNNDNDKPTPEKYITFNLPENISAETAFVESNNYLIITLTNNTKENIVKANLNVTIKSNTEKKEVNLLPIGNKAMFRILIPNELNKQVTKEKINISLHIIEKGNDFNFIDISKITKDKPSVEVVEKDTNIKLTGVNKTEKDINALIGFVLLYNNNKIVGAKDFRVENIKNNDIFSTSLTIPKIVIPSSDLTPDEINYGQVNYEKIEVYYTYAY